MSRALGWGLFAFLSLSAVGRAQSNVEDDRSAFQQLLDELQRKGVLSEEDRRRIGDAAAKEESAAAKVLAGYDKGFFIRSRDEKFLLRIGGFGDFRYTYFDRDQDASPESDDKSSFRLRKVRVKLYGNTFEPWVAYFLQWENTGSSLSLLDSYVDLYDKKELPEIGLRFGQFKPPFSRQFLVADENLDFTERSIANDFFFFDRDQGALIHGKPFGTSPNVEYWTGLFNGNGRNQSDNPDTGLLWASRLEWNVIGEPGYTEGDVDDSQDAKWAIASSYAYDLVTVTTSAGDRVDNAISRWEADTSFKWRGFSFQGEAYVDSQTPDDRSPDLAGVHASGTYVQAGFFVIPKEMELAARYAYIHPDVDATPNRQETTVGARYYFAGHPWKLQADLRRLTDARDPGTDSRELQFILQMQVSF